MDSMNDLRCEVRSRLGEFPDTPTGDYKLADELLDKMPANMIRSCAQEYIAEYVHEQRRQFALEVERAAERVRSAESDDGEQWCASCRESYATKALYAAHKQGDPDQCTLARRAYWEKYPWAAPPRTRVHREWLLTEKGREWKARQDARQEEERYRQQLRVDDPEAYENQYGFSGIMRRFEDAVREELLLELTSEFLSSTFALGDGVRVTWHDATYDQQQQRIKLLSGNVTANLKDIQRHTAACRLMDAYQADTLGEVAAQQTNVSA